MNGSMLPNQLCTLQCEPAVCHLIVKATPGGSIVRYVSHNHSTTGIYKYQVPGNNCCTNRCCVLYTLKTYPQLYE